ncbi:AIPR family protein [Aeromonas sp. 2692-1]|uniref:AIPR family protein n=1 Tax=Aeromonas sp. 2692-1 TaxID=2560029 RepID=UPI00148B0E49|nr:AIPR family protein [Aeromonas sp. 2692-1]QJT14431.1 AIPR family protein [Aeromonas sp. 2692-1]
MSNWFDAFQSRTDLQVYNDNALALFALALRFRTEDLDTVAAESITDGRDDKKCDLVYVNREDGYAVIAQCYLSLKDKPAAPANKASDLNTALGWLLSRSINEVPEIIKSAAQELRDAILQKEVTTIYIWYVHNLPHSNNVRDELITVHETASSIIKQHFSQSNIDLQVFEVGNEMFSDWYEDSQSPILVNDEVEVDCNGAYEVSGPGWKAVSATIPAALLHRLYKKHKTKVFSANIRDYLGSRSSDSNINNGIKSTLDNEHDNFWVYNNGLTILTHAASYDPTKGKLSFRGLSIVNGAQTTGAIGSLRKLPHADTVVQARFVATTNGDEELIRKIIQYNNSQNKIEASDFRSTDKVQRRLKEEISKIPNAEYDGGRRGGVTDAIRRRVNLLPSYTVGQALTAFHGDPITAYNQKSGIWVNDRLYGRIFNESTHGAHIVCAYALIRSIEDRKTEIIQKDRNGASLTKMEQDYLEYFRRRGSIFLFASAIVSCLEIFLSRQVPNLFRVSFGNSCSPAKAQEYWKTVVDVGIPFCKQLVPALDGGLKNTKSVNDAISTFRSLVQATSNANQNIYDQFKAVVISPIS